MPEPVTTSSRRLASVLAAAAATLTAGLPAQTSPALEPAAGGFTAAAEVRLVEIPVQVTQRGEPVRGLTATDFSVYAGKQPQRIVGFEMVDLQVLSGANEAAPPLTRLPAAGRRHFLFLFDLSHSDPRSLQRAQQAGLEIARTSLHAADLAAVAVYSPARGARLLLGFTSDRAQVALAISTLGSTELIERRPDYLGLLLGQARDNLARLERAPERPIEQLREAASGGEGTPFERPSETLARKLVDEALLLESMTERDLASGERDRVRRFTTSLRELAGLMQQVQGRKHVLFLSRGFDGTLLSGQETPLARQIESADEELKEITRTDSDRRWGNSRLQGELRRSLQEMRRADCVVHAIDISGAEIHGRAIAGEMRDVAAAPLAVGRGAESLLVMAEETGGTLHRNFNDLAPAIGRVLQATEVTYVLAIQPDAGRARDGYVPLRVELPGRRGLEVSHRAGYFEEAPGAVRGALEERLRIASEVLEGRTGGAVRSSLLAIPAPWGTAGAQVVVEIDGGSLLAGHSGDAVSAEVTLYAFDPAGGIRDQARQLVGMDLRSVGERLRRSGVKLIATLDLPPGRFDLRSLVRNTVTGRYGIASAALTVPATAPEAVSAVFAQPQAHDWLLVREAGEEGAAAPPYPFTVGEAVLVPASGRLRGGAPATLWLEARPGLAAGELSARVKRPDGSVVGAGELRPGERAAAGGGERLIAGFTAPALAPGSYLLELRLQPAAGSPATTEVPFTVE